MAVTAKPSSPLTSAGFAGGGMTFYGKQEEVEEAALWKRVK